MKTLRPSAAVLVAAIGVFVWLSVAVTGGGAVTRFDTRVAIWVAASMPGWAEWIARPFTWLGSFYGLLAAALLAALWLASRRRWIDVLLVAGVLVAEIVLVQALKNGFDRARPDEGSAISLSDSYSFPSGHATGSVAVIGAIAILLTVGLRGRRRALLVGGALVVAFCVGASRVVLNVHYVSDVGAGFCLGLAIVSASLLIREAILPCRGRRPRTPRRAVEGDRGPARLGP